MAVGVVMGGGRARVVQNSPKPKATTGSVAETIEVFYGAGTVVSLYDFIPCWKWTGTEFAERSCTFIEGENFQLAANIIQHTGDVAGVIYADFFYYDEDAATWVSLFAERGEDSPQSIDGVGPGKYVALYYLEDVDVYHIQYLGNDTSHYGAVVIVPGKYRTYELGKTHYFGFKAWGEDEEEPTLPTPV